jgi:hypothetical protein
MSATAIRRAARGPLARVALLCVGAWSAAIAPLAAVAQGSFAVPHEVDAWRTRYVSTQRTFDGRRPHYVDDTARFVVGRIDLRPVAALLFTLEGMRAPDDWQQYAAVFWSSAGHYLYCCVQRVGAKGTRLLDDIGIVDDRIRLSGKAYADGDAPCCPTRPVSVRYALSRHRIVEVGAAR